jgi:hypothetical protein
MITPSFNLTATERVLPRLALDFTTASLDSRVTFTRSGNTATVVNSSGLVATINANLPRFDYNPVTLACKGLLIEESRTNLCLYSDNLQSSTGVWGLTSCTAVENDINGPDGTLSAEKLTATGSFPRLAQTITLVDNTNYTISIFVKKGDAYVFSLYVVNKVNTTIQTFFDVNAGTVTSGTGTIEPYANGFYRCSMTFNSASGATAPVLRFVNNAQGVTGGWSGTNYLYAWGAQLEAGAFATSYIPTVASQVTRSADVATMTGTNFSDWYNSSQGSLYAEFQYIGAPKATGGAASINNNTTSNRVLSLEIGTTNGLVATSTSGFTGATLVAMTSGTVYKATLAVNSNEFAFAYNGNATTQQSGTINATSMTQLEFGGLAGQATRVQNIYLRKVNYYPQRLINNEVQATSK